MKSIGTEIAVHIRYVASVTMCDRESVYSFHRRIPENAWLFVRKRRRPGEANEGISERSTSGNPITRARETVV